MTDFIPGFSIIKSKVISPLLVATEKVVDYFLPDQYSSAGDKSSHTDGTDQFSDERST
jgi:hypothetical protein